MLRQVGLAIGVAVLIAVIGEPRRTPASLSAFRHGWIVIAGVSLLGALVGTAALRAPRRAGPEAMDQATTAAGETAAVASTALPVTESMNRGTG